MSGYLSRAPGAVLVAGGGAWTGTEEAGRSQVLAAPPRERGDSGFGRGVDEAREIEARTGNPEYPGPGGGAPKGASYTLRGHKRLRHAVFAPSARRKR